MGQLRFAMTGCTSRLGRQYFPRKLLNSIYVCGTYRVTAIHLLLALELLCR